MKYIIILIVLMVMVSVALSSSAMQKRDRKPVDFNSYEESWEIVEQFEKVGQTQSALKEVELILKQAEMESNEVQLVKALLHKFKYTMILEEDAEAKIITMLDEAIAASGDVVVKSILHSIKAEALWDYYQDNRYQFLQRTTQTERLNDDFRTWDLRSLLGEIKQEYLASLQEPTELQKHPVDSFDYILLQQDESELYRPTLYDLLAHRAIDFFISGESGLTEPLDEYSLDNADFFAAAENFIGIDLTESASLKRDVLRQLQLLLRFRSGEENKAALMDADLKRLSYLLEHSSLEGKDALYVTALQNLAERNADEEFSAYINYRVASHWNMLSSADESIADNKDDNLRIKARDLCNATIKKFPESFGAQNCLALLQQLEARELSVKTERVILPGAPDKVLVTYRNVSRADLRLVRLTSDEAASLYKGAFDRENWRKTLSNRKPYRDWLAPLTDPGDLYSHTAELVLEALETGVYILFAAIDGDFVNNVSVAGEIWVSQLSYITRTDDQGRLEIYVVDRDKGAPIPEAEVESYYMQYDYQARENKKIKLAVQRTDENGKVLVEHPEDNRGWQVSFSIRKGGDFLDVSNSIYLPRPFEFNHKWQQQTFYFTDRAIYRPGQTVYFKGITLETNGEQSRILSGRKIDVEFRDVNYKEIARLSSVSNEYGSFQGSFTAPSAGLMGQMTIQGGNGQQYISVEEYKRPTFEVVLDTVRGSYSLGLDVVMTGKGISYAGAPLINSIVAYRVVREVRYPRWYGWGYYRMPPAGSGSKEIAFGETTTGNDGSFSVTFKTIPDLSVSRESDPRFVYTLHVDITDISGETRSNSKSLTAGYTGLDLNISHGQNWDRTIGQTIGVSTSNLDGRNEAADVTISLFRLETKAGLLRERLWEQPDIFLLNEEEFSAIFHGDVFKSVGDPERGRELVKVFNINTGNQDEVSISPEMLSKSGEYWIEAVSKDGAGNPVRYEGKVAVFAATDKIPASPVHLSLKAVNESWQPGETATVEISSSIDDAHIIYHLSHDGKARESKILRMSNSIQRISIPITEQDRGGLVIHCAVVSRNRIYTQELNVDVPFVSHDLQVEWMAFRDLLKPGQKEEWKIKIKGPDGDKVQAELLASMYDKSLDYFTPHDYYFSAPLHPNVRRASGYSASGNFEIAPHWILAQIYETPPQIVEPQYDQLNLFGFRMTIYDYRLQFRSDGMSVSSVRDGIKSAPAAMEDADGNSGGESFAYANGIVNDAVELQEKAIENDPTKPQIGFSPRRNLNETAFFFPNLQTNAEGETTISFEMPEALTTWKFMGLAHDKDLNSAIFTKEIRTQKDLMVTPHFPRFFREGDKVTVTAKVDNLTDGELNGKVTLVLKDALTGNEIHDRLVEENEKLLTFPAKGSAAAEWEIWVNDEYQAISYEVYAVSGDFTDGVSNTLPVLTNRMLVTETLPVWLKGAGERSFMLEHLKQYNSTTLKHHQLTLEYASNPAWYAVQALPYLMEFPYECAEQLFSRYYANSLAVHIANSNPRIRDIFDQWRTLDPDALLSNLEKNQELKAVLIEETPWLRDAEDESERKKRIALLFDLNRMAGERQAVIAKLMEMQTPNGGFAWFSGMPDSRYITQHILTGLAHLQQLNVEDVMADDEVRGIIDKAIPYLDARIREDFREIQKYDKDWKKNDHLGQIQIQYLYVRSHFRDYTFDEGTKEAFDYFLEQAEKFWLDKGLYSQAMISIALHGYLKKESAAQIIVSMKENSIVSDEMGMYWKSIEQGGYYWYNAPIEAQAMLIEAFHTVADDGVSVNEMKVWLLKQKQVQDWRTTKATAEAVFALLLRGDDWLAASTPVTVKVGDKIVDVKSMDETYEAGTGYFKVKWNSGQIDRAMAEVSVSSKTNAPSWGALYWQYFEDLDKIETFEGTPLKLDKKLFVESYSNTGPVITPLAQYGDIKPGDKLKVRIELTVDRNMEFVHMKDMRASGLEPENVLSQYKYQDGLGYYESTRDAATHFFFDYLPKGIYVFEYALRVSHKGDFSNGITTIQSMYAPEFTSHSEGVRVEVK